MKVKFNKFERVAGLFLLMTLAMVVVSVVSIAIQKGWFESKVEYQTDFDTADGLVPGTNVHMNGLRVGSVDEVILGNNNRVLVKFHIVERLAERVKKDSVVRTYRPFVIGDRVLEVTVGSDSSEKLAAGSLLKSEKGMDVMDLVGGRQLGPYMETVKLTMDRLTTLLEAFHDPKRIQSIIDVVDQLNPTLIEVRAMAREMKTLGQQATGKKRLEKTLGNLLVSTQHLNKVLPEMVLVFENSPELGRNAGNIVENLSSLTEEMKKLIPAIAAVAPELPEASKKAIEAMSEAVITLKAMQKSFLLKGAVDDIREEEEEKKRVPASEED